jgi:hypothetical protein
MPSPYSSEEIALYTANGLWNTEENPRIQQMGNNIEWHMWDNPLGGTCFKEIDTRTGKQITSSQRLALVDILAPSTTPTPKRKKK